MTKGMRIFVILSAVIVLVACVALLGSCSGKYESNTYEITDNFVNLSIKVDTGDVEILPSDGETVKIVFYERSWMKHEVAVSDGTLALSQTGKKPWYYIIGVGAQKTKMTVYLPKGEYGSFNFECSTGDLSVAPGYTFGSTTMDATTGDITLGGGTYADLSIRLTTGDISLDGVVCDSLSMDSGTGDKRIEGCNIAGDLTSAATTGKTAVLNSTCGGNLTVKSGTGDQRIENCNITGSLSAKTTTGDQRIENCNITGSLSAKTTTGDLAMSNVVCADFSGEASDGKTTVSNSDFASFKAVATTGDLSLDGVIISGKLEVERNTGEVAFNKVDFGEADITTTTGSVKGSILSDKVIFADTGSGKVEVPHLTSGGRCEVKTTSGAVILTIEP